MSFLGEEEIRYVRLGHSQTRTVRKPRRLSCGGHADIGWVITQTAYLVDGEFWCQEQCQICAVEEYGYEFPNAPRHGNVPIPEEKSCQPK